LGTVWLHALLKRIRKENKKGKRKERISEERTREQRLEEERNFKRKQRKIRKENDV
jgi:Flp pilus assembly protein TadB